LWLCGKYDINKKGSPFAVSLSIFILMFKHNKNSPPSITEGNGDDRDVMRKVSFLANFLQI
jgi:hypothetical protein